MKRITIIYAVILVLFVLLVKNFIHPPKKPDKAITDTNFRLSSLFAENAVLQREKPIKIFGTAEPGSKIELNLAGKHSSTKTNKDGTWLITLNPIKAGGPYQLKASNGQKTLELNHIYVGDVWLAAGQSNMIWFVNSALNSEKTIAEAENYTNKVFALHMNARPSEKPISAFESVVSQWLNTNSQTVRDFGAVPYAFAREIYDDQKVPIAIIRVAAGNTLIQSHMSKESLVGYKGLKKLETLALNDQSVWYQTLFNSNMPRLSTQSGYFLLCTGKPDQQQNFTIFFNDGKIVNRDLDTNCSRLDIRILRATNILQIRVSPKRLKNVTLKELAEEFNKTKVIFNGEELELNHWDVVSEIAANTPSANFNAKINPVTLYPIKGVLWYQGESNIDDYSSYKRLFTALVKDWRKRWKEELPFITVQLHNFKTDHPENLLKFREIQYELSKELEKVYIVDVFDLCDPDLDIHPQNKDEVGHRLALMAKEKVY